MVHEYVNKTQQKLSEGLNEAKDSVQSGYKQSVNAGQDYAAKASDSLGSAAQTAKNTGENSWENTVDSSKSHMNDAKGTASSAYNDAKQKFSGGSSGWDSTAGNAKDEASKYLNVTSEKAHNAKDSAAGAFGSAGNSAKGKMNEFQDTAKDKYQSASNFLKDKHSEAGAHIQNASESAKGHTEGGVHDIKESIMNAKDSAVDKVHSIADSLKGKSENLQDGAKDSANSGGNQMKDMYRGATQKISNIASGISSSIKGNASKAGSEAENAAQSAQDKMGKTAGSVQDQLRNQVNKQAAVGGDQGGVLGSADHYSSTISSKHPGDSSNVPGSTSFHVNSTADPSVTANDASPLSASRGCSPTGGGDYLERALYSSDKNEQMAASEKFIGDDILTAYTRKLGGSHGNAISSADQQTFNQMVQTRCVTFTPADAQHIDASSALPPSTYPCMKGLGSELAHECKVAAMQRDVAPNGVLPSSKNYGGPLASAAQHEFNVSQCAAGGARGSQTAPWSGGKDATNGGKIMVQTPEDVTTANIREEGGGSSSPVKEDQQVSPLKDRQQQLHNIRDTITNEFGEVVARVRKSIGSVFGVSSGHASCGGGDQSGRSAPTRVSAGSGVDVGDLYSSSRGAAKKQNTSDSSIGLNVTSPKAAETLTVATVTAPSFPIPSISKKDPGSGEDDNPLVGNAELPAAAGGSSVPHNLIGGNSLIHDNALKEGRLSAVASATVADDCTPPPPSASKSPDKNKDDNPLVGSVKLPDNAALQSPTPFPPADNVATDDPSTPHNLIGGNSLINNNALREGRLSAIASATMVDGCSSSFPPAPPQPTSYAA